jgi:hypothetical protein
MEIAPRLYKGDDSRLNGPSFASPNESLSKVLNLLRSNNVRMVTFYRRSILALVSGAGLLFMTGFLIGCDDTSAPAKLDPVASKATEEEQAKAREAAYGKSGMPGTQFKGGRPVNTPKK